MKIVKAKNEQRKPKHFYLRAQVTRFIRNRLPDEKILTFFVCFKGSILCLFVCLLSILRFGFGGCIQLNFQGVPSSGCKIVQIAINIRSEVYIC